MQTTRTKTTTKNVSSYGPFLRWAGGKTQLLPEILRRIPKDIDTYYEPFLGGGAVFFALHAEAAAGTRRIRRYVLSDVNEELITTYEAVRDDVEGVIRGLRRHASNYNAGRCGTDRRAVYEVVRAHGALGAARTIFLNKTGFNGLYRVNKKGEFNVPWGKKEKYVPDVDGLRAASEILLSRGVTIRRSNFLEEDWRFNSRESHSSVFGYFDPPYAPASVTSSFCAYTANGFGSEEQVKLRDQLARIAGGGGRVLASNADAKLIRDIYCPPRKFIGGGSTPRRKLGKDVFLIERVSARRNINSRGSARGPVGELLISAGGDR
jgi:DNA adenine methylase